MITDLNEYTDGVLVTVSGDQKGWRKDIPPRLYNFMHAITGLETEIAELMEAICVQPSDIDWVNVKEELGDLWWYMALAYETFGRALKPDLEAGTAVKGSEMVQAMYEEAIQYDNGKLSRFDLQYMMIVINQLTVITADGMDVIKRRIYYFSDDSDPKAAWDKFDMTRALKTLTVLTLGCALDPRRVWTTNLLKSIGPDGRYKDQFDPEKAVCRNLVKEREVLEGDAV